MSLDSNVPIQRVGRRKQSPKDDPRAADLLEMEIDTGRNSRFYPGKQIQDFRSLRKLAARLGVHLIFRYFGENKDAIYSEAGTRIWRVSPPEDDF